MVVMMKTQEVSRLLGVPYWRLSYAIAAGKLPSPPKDFSGDYTWGPEDIARARKVLSNRRRHAAANA